MGQMIDTVCNKLQIEDLIMLSQARTSLTSPRAVLACPLRFQASANRGSNWMAAVKSATASFSFCLDCSKCAIGESPSSLRLDCRA